MRSQQLPERFPIGAKYVLESFGPLVRRHVEFPDGRKIQLEWRKAQSCTCAERRPSDLVQPQRRARTEAIA
jgi:hypothetical protein